MEKLNSKPLKIAFTGPECSGKTTLANWLATELNAILVSEYAREYLTGSANSYQSNDLDRIAQMQFMLEEKALESGSKFIVCDSDLLVMKVWSEVGYNSASPLIEELFERSHYDFTFLCKPDFDWVFDPLREYPDDAERMGLFTRYEKHLKNGSGAFTVLEGSLETRKAAVLKALDNKYIQHPSKAD